LYKPGGLSDMMQQNDWQLLGNICDIEVVRQGDAFVAKVRFEEEKSIREFRSPNFEGILEQLQMNLQDKFEDL